MQVYAIRFKNFMRFGEKDNSVLFDVLPEDQVLLDKNEITIDEIYDRMLKDPITYVEKVKKMGLRHLIGIAGIIGDNYDLSNGVGKSTILEGICYAHYEQIVRKNVNTDKTAGAGLSVVTKINGKYPPKMRESWVEEIFEENGKIYRIKRGRTFTSTQQSNSPLLEFVCYNDAGGSDSQAGHRKADTNESIEQVNSMSYDLFVNSVLFGQSDAGKFLTGTDKIRKEMLVSLLKLEDVINGFLKKIRERKNAKEKDMVALNAQIDAVDNNLKTKESIVIIEDKIQKLKDNINVAEIQIKERTKKIEELSGSDAVKTLESIRAEGKKIKEDLNAQKITKESQIKEWNNLSEETNKKIMTEEIKIETFAKKRKEAKESQIKEWNNLSSESDKGIREENTKIQDLSTKLKETQDQITKCEADVKVFDMATREETLKRAIKAKEWKPKLSETIINLQNEKEKIVIDISPERAENNRLDKEITLLQSQLNNVKTDDFICDKCKSKVSRKHIQDEIMRLSDLKSNCNSKIKLLETQQGEVVAKLTKTQSNLEKANELLIREGKIRAEIQENDNKKIIRETKKTNLDDYNKRIEDAKAKIISLNKQKLEYTQKGNAVSIAHDTETNKLLEDMKGEILLLNKQKEEYIQKSIEISKKYDVEIEIMQSKLNGLGDRFIKAKKDAEDTEGIIKRLRSDNEDTVKCKSQYDSMIGSLNKDIENINKETLKLQQLKDRLTDEIALLNRLIMLEDIYGLEGIQTRIVKRYLPLLNNYIKEVLDVLSNGEMRVLVYINDKGKVDIAIEGSMADNFTMTSGGEKMNIKIGVDIGLALLSFCRCAQKPEIICLDEVFDPLDAYHTQAVFRLINKLQDKFNRVIVISHKENINKIISHQILIEKGIGILGQSKVRRIK